MRRILAFSVLLLFLLVLGQMSAFGTGKTIYVGDCSGLLLGKEWIWGYKMSLYISNNPTPDKTDNYSNYDLVKRKIFVIGSKYDGNAFVASGDKFYYATQYINNSCNENAVPFSYVKSKDSGIEVELDCSWLPQARLEDQLYHNELENFFKQDHIEGELINKLSDGSLDQKTDTWVLLVEPIVACKTPKIYTDTGKAYKAYYLTATELALSYARCGKGHTTVIGSNNFYNPYYCIDGEGKDKNGKPTTIHYGGNPGLVAINNVCCALSCVNGEGNWLGLSSSPNVDNSWSLGGSDPHTYTKNNWGTVVDDIIRHGGVKIYYSQAFELPDYTGILGINDENPYEGQTVVGTACISRGESVIPGAVHVVIKYDGVVITETTLEFSKPGQREIIHVFPFNAGEYDKTNGDTARKLVEMTFEAVGDVPDINPDNNNRDEQKKWITLKRDFSVQDLTVNGQTVTEVKEKTDVIVRFSIANNNPYKGYDGVKVRVKIKRPNGTKELAQKTVNFAIGEIKNCELLVNVGNVTANSDQMFTIIAEINYAEINYNRAWHEPNISNNITDENKYGNIIVTRDINFAMKIIAGVEIGAEKQKYSNNNAGLTTGGRTTGMVTCVIKNISGFNMYENNSSEDRLYAIVYSPVDNESSVVCVPANGTNITWFKFTVPNSTSVTFTGKLKWIYKKTFYYTDSEGNVHSYRKDVTKYFTATPDTAGINNVTVNAPDDTGLVKGSEQLVQTDSSEYSSASAYVVNRAGYPRVARWEQWKMNGHTFVLHRYALAGEVKRAVMTPANFGQDTEYVNSNGQIASGSAFTLDFQYDVMTESSRGDAVSPSAYTLVQNGIARFPEFKYQLGNKKTRTMFFKNDSIDSKTMFFNTNQYADDANGGGESPENHIGQRVHFTPLNMPDGKYKIAVEAYDLWTPAGMIYVISTPSLEISGSIFDYNYMN